jgi:MoaA/NifB/PqqE/SkfB family radical SAM enzyme
MIVVWRVTQRCNLSCPFCEWDRSLPKERADVDTEEVLRFAVVLSAWQAVTGEPVLLSWLGGEPLLWPALSHVAERVGALGLRQSTTTNGTTLGRPAVQDLVLRHFAELTVSVDGFPDFHDPMRGWPGGHGRLRHAVEALSERRANREALRLRANVVLMRQNVDSFTSLCEALSEWGIDEITFNALGGRDRPEFYPAHALRPQDVDELRALVPSLRSRLAVLGTRLCGDEAYLDRLAASAAGQPISIASCAPGQRFLFIDERCRIAPCDFTVASYGVPSETVRSARDLQELPARFAALQREARASACDDCRSTRVFAKFSA